MVRNDGGIKNWTTHFPYGSICHLKWRLPMWLGVASMSPALRDLEQVLLEGELAHGDHPVLSMCVSNTVIALDDAGNRKPSKKRSVGHIDGLVALTMAIGVAPLQAKTIDIEAMIG